jgi:N4-gp56 family major capsid protein
MADSRVATGLTVEQWDDQFFVEYLSENRFSGEMGSDENNIIQVKENLTKKPGDRINYALVNKLTQDAVTGRANMEGNEEDMASRSYEQTIDKRRNAVRFAEVDEQFSAISLRQAAKHTLKDWSMKDTETLIIQALASINGTNYASASEASKDEWLIDNADRIRLGTGAAVGTDHSTALATVTGDTASHLLTPAHISAMKYLALVTASPKVRPIRVAANGKRYFILYAHPAAFEDLKTNTTITQAQREVTLEMENNRLFNGGDLLWDGVIVKSVDEMNAEINSGFLNVGGGTLNDIAPCFLCGAQAVAAAYARRWKTVTEEFDYGDKHGVEISSIYGIGKMKFGSGTSDTADLKDHGVVTGYFGVSRQLT